MLAAVIAGTLVIAAGIGLIWKRVRVARFYQNAIRAFWGTLGDLPARAMTLGTVGMVGILFTLSGAVILASELTRQ
ncbi:hypothetical protein GY21_20715 [Cryobacterium roopkundense]|uniref:Uncharacterized protein n=1 Tax=Cryobacterium roopkundense TaxID=1001240 RepID=A0A099J2I9_9MICO|nr:hypothetical protein GY21_20715 [Cryobacterium roopkundense]MBB5643198.1 hypothetical protein [Cryobacterium roopkundense]